MENKTIERRNRFKVRMKSLMKIIVLLLFIVVLSSTLDLILNLHITAINRTEYIAFHEIGNDANQTLLINKILKWESDNMINTDINKSYPCVTIPNCFYYANVKQGECLIPNILLQNYYLVSLTKCGKCGEFVGIFSEIANKFGIKNKIIIADHIDGNNHAWIEIINDNETTPVETTNVNGFNESKFYNCTWLIKYRNIRTDSGEDVSRTYYNRCS